MTPKKQKQPGGVHETTATPAEGFTPFLGALRQLIADSRQQLLRAVDVVRVQTCWHVGRPTGSVCCRSWGRRCRQSLGGVSTPPICAICGGLTKHFRFATHCIAN